ncbi:MAG: gephyrin-like molybdotransferase Glp [Candidatus Altiarchaeota archaeon]
MSRGGFKNLISFEEAQRRMGRHQMLVGTERVRLEDSLGRVLAETVKSRINVPGFRKSAMDGYAVRYSDVRSASKSSPKALDCVDVVRAGQVSRKRLKRGECIEIATGAPIPSGADSVVIVENTLRKGKKVTVFEGTGKGYHIITAGSDIRKRTAVISRGSVIDAYGVGLLASIGLESVRVCRKPKIALIATGNEIVDIGKPLSAGKIYGTNNLSIGALLTGHGCDAVDLGVCRDVQHPLRMKLTSALKTSDLVIVSGGSSVGEEDIVPDVVRELGRVIFHGIAIRPGKPVLFGKVNGKPVIGLPGNPTSALIVLNALVLPYIMASMKSSWSRRRLCARMAKDFIFKKRLKYFLPVRLEARGGASYVIPTFKGSNAITSLSDADGYIVMEADVSKIKKGSPVEVNLL